MLAYGLAREDKDVIIFDYRAPWEKPCGGMLGPKTIEEHPILASYPYPITACRGIWYISPRSQRRFVPANQPLPVISRLEFGKFLLDKAREAGAKFIQQKVANISWDGSKWDIETNHGLYTAALIVGADGATSIVRKSIVGKIHKEHLSLACGYFLTGIPMEQYIIKFLDVQGYLWIFSRADHASAGIGARLGTTSGKVLFGKLDDFLKEHYPSATKSKRWAALVPTVQDASFYNQPCCGDNWILVGDAAGHVDPASGEGIYYALQSAKLAYQSILKDDLTSYESAWRATYGHVLRDRAALMQRLTKLAIPFGPTVIGTLLYNYSVGSAKRVSCERTCPC